MNKIVIIGGDKRQKELERILSGQGFRCRHIYSDDDIKKDQIIGKCDVIILPVPVSKDGENVYSADSSFRISIKDAVGKADSSNMIFGGNIPKVIKAILIDKDIFCFDYLECSEYALYNAYLTGLGAVKLLQENAACDLKEKKVLITGYGKVARFTAQAMLKEGCDVYVSARNSLQRLEAECSGCKAIELSKISSFLYLFDYIFNTVPENIFSFEDVSHMKGKYFELASSPFGAKKDYFVSGADKYIFGGSLPGRYLPYSAAEKLAEITIKHIKLRNGGD